MAANTLSAKASVTESGRQRWHQERIILEATERLCELMEKQAVSRTELADRLGTNKSRVSQLLNGTANMTLRTLSDLYLALGRAAHVVDGPLSPDGTAEPAGGFLVPTLPAESIWKTVYQSSITFKAIDRMAATDDQADQTFVWSGTVDLSPQLT